MKRLRPDADPEAFLAALAAAPARILLLDYDGTLAPFREERDEAVPYPEARELVRDIQADGHTRVVVISGRAIAVLRPLLGLEPAPELWGTHGWERLHPDGRSESADPGAAALAALASAAERGERLTGAARVERKPASVALHTRGLDAAEAERVLAGARDAWHELSRGDGLEIHEFDGGLELRVGGRDKGTAVREILAEAPPGAAVAYLGDDRTDEDAFRALGRHGLSVLVRAEPRETAAQLWIRPPEELIDFLRSWRREAARAPRSAGNPS